MKGNKYRNFVVLILLYFYAAAPNRYSFDQPNGAQIYDEWG